MNSCSPCLHMGAGSMHTMSLRVDISPSLFPLGGCWALAAPLSLPCDCPVIAPCHLLQLFLAVSRARAVGDRGSDQIRRWTGLSWEWQVNNSIWPAYGPVCWLGWEGSPGGRGSCQSNCLLLPTHRCPPPRRIPVRHCAPSSLPRGFALWSWVPSPARLRWAPGPARSS